MEEYTQITLDEWTSWKEDIRRKLAETAGNFVYIGYRLKQIRDSGMYDGATDIFEFAQKEYGLGKSTVSRFIAINEKYSEGGNSLELKEEFKAFSSSKLSEMLTLPDSEIELITEKTTIREIRELKNFNQQDPEPEQEAETTWSALDKCLIDFFEPRREMLNKVMECMDADPPEYKEAAETMTPSGQSSHKKGIMFLFMYDWNTGIKYKLMTQPEPVSMTWQEFLNEIYGIYALCSQEDVWTDFYKKEKVSEPQSNQGIEPPVATSQQTEEKGEENEPEDVENAPDNVENAPELGENKTESEENASEEEENENDEEAAVVQDEESEEGSTENDAEPVADDSDELTSGDAGSEEGIPGDIRGVDGDGSEETGICETAESGSEEAAVDTEMEAGKYDQAIRELIDTIAYKSEKIADAMKEKDRKELSEYRKLRAAIYNMASDIEQLMKFIDLSEDGEEEEE